MLAVKEITLNILFNLHKSVRLSISTSNEYDPTLQDILIGPVHEYDTFDMLITANLKGKLSVEVVIILDVKSALCKKNIDNCIQVINNFLYRFSASLAFKI